MSHLNVESSTSSMMGIRGTIWGNSSLIGRIMLSIVSSITCPAIDLSFATDLILALS